MVTREINKDDVKVSNRGLILALKTSRSDLERVTGNIDRSLPSMGASKMPEYQAALKAINNYITATSERFSKLAGEKYR